MSQAVRNLSDKRAPIVLHDDEIFAAHLGGKLSVALNAPLDTQRALSVAYTPGVYATDSARCVSRGAFSATASFPPTCAAKISSSCRTIGGLLSDRFLTAWDTALRLLTNW